MSVVAYLPCLIYGLSVPSAAVKKVGRATDSAGLTSPEWLLDTREASYWQGGRGLPPVDALWATCPGSLIDLDRPTEPCDNTSLTVKSVESFVEPLMPSIFFHLFFFFITIFFFYSSPSSSFPFSSSSHFCFNSIIHHGRLYQNGCYKCCLIA